MVNKIKIAVQGAKTIPLNQLEPFQEDLKILEKDQYEKLKNIIQKMGFSFTIHVWRHNKKNYIIDGHQRVSAVKTMVEKEGFICPSLPVSIVEAKDFNEAKRKVLAGASQYGIIQQQGLYNFMINNQIDFEELSASFDFPEVDFDIFNNSFFEKPELKSATGSTDLTHMGNSKMVHQCPKCGFEFDGNGSSK